MFGEKEKNEWHIFLPLFSWWCRVGYSGGEEGQGRFRVWRVGKGGIGLGGEEWGVGGWLGWSGIKQTLWLCHGSPLADMTECQMPSKVSVLTWVSAYENVVWIGKLTWTFCACTKTLSDNSHHLVADINTFTHSNPTRSTTKKSTKVSCNETERAENSWFSKTAPANEGMTCFCDRRGNPQPPKRFHQVFIQNDHTAVFEHRKSAALSPELGNNQPTANYTWYTTRIKQAFFNETCG